MKKERLIGILQQVEDLNSDDFPYCKTEEFLFRFILSSGTTQIAVRESFDRWANSVDFIMYKIPETIFEMKAMILAAKRLYYAGSWDSRSANELNITGELRNAKQALKQAEKQRKESEQIAMIQKYVGNKKRKRPRTDKRMRSAPASIRF
ncbi:hypothetical protein ACFL2U_00710 [Patescibacteria group bacterium]